MTGTLDLAQVLLLVLVGAIASGINSVAGGGSLISFPTLTVGLGLGEKVANATNSVGLWPGSLAGGFGFGNLLQKTAPYLKALFLPTLLGSVAGSWLLLSTSNALFRQVIPVLILFAALLLWFQPKVKAFVQRKHEKLPVWVGVLLQFLVSVYGGYFGAGMGIMMLAAFALYMDGNIHELNAVKSWLGLIINFTASIVFVVKGLVVFAPAAALVVGSLIGGYAAARVSQRVDAEKMRLAIAIYGIGMSAVFFYRAYF